MELLHGLAGLLLVAGVDDGIGASGQAGVASLDLGVGAAVIILLFDGDLLRLVIRKLFNSGVRHAGQLNRSLKLAEATHTLQPHDGEVELAAGSELRSEVMNNRRQSFSEEFSYLPT